MMKKYILTVALLLIYNRRPQRYVNPVLDDSPGSV